MTFKERPYTLFLVWSIVAFLTSFFVFRHPIEIAFTGRYYTIQLPELFRIISFIDLIIWSIYALRNVGFFAKKLIWTHLFLEGLVIMGLLYLANFSKQYFSAFDFLPLRYVDYQFRFNANSNWHIVSLLMLLIVIFLSGLVVFTANLALGSRK